MARDGEDDAGALADGKVSGLDVLDAEFVTTTADGTRAPICQVARPVSVPVRGRDGTVCCRDDATLQVLVAASHHKVLKAVAQPVASVVPAAAAIRPRAG